MMTPKEIVKIRDAVKSTGVRKVAKKLGIDRVTLYRAMTEVIHLRPDTVNQIRSKLGAL